MVKVCERKQCVVDSSNMDTVPVADGSQTATSLNHCRGRAVAESECNSREKQHGSNIFPESQNELINIEMFDHIVLAGRVVLFLYSYHIQ